ncbi:DUF1178 family protein [Sphingomonas sp. CFBP 13714]|uniref:DUF1178 family protein n=1 Tax=Sphingomonas sp. CFBP 13714 TaxID=2775308 RepID=UPI0017847C4B|nr:DUF1178 family protein [Sphingomonas sp. CFBP 13714]
MIVFDLKCGTGQVFEAWFGSSAAYEAQRAARQVECPLCGDAEVAKAVMAPAVSGKGNRVPEGPTPARMKAMMTMLASKQAELLASSRWVGGAFADRARDALGDEAPTPIHGQASLAEARALVEDGVAVLPLPLPVTPPDTIN